MITITSQPDSNIIEFDFAGSLRVEDEQRVQQAFDDAIAHHGSVRALVRVGDFDVREFEPKALWMDVKNARYVKNLDKLALLSDAGWMTGLTGAFGKVVPHVQVETFAAGDTDAALAWLRG